MKKLSRDEMKKVMGGKYGDGPCYYTCNITENYANGTSSTYGVEFSSSDPNAAARHYAASVVSSGYAQSASAATCSTGCVA